MKKYTDVMNDHLHVLTPTNSGYNFPASVRKQWLLEQCPKWVRAGKCFTVRWTNMGLGVWRAYILADEV